MKFTLSTAKFPKLNNLELDILQIDEIRLVNLSSFCQATGLQLDYVENILEKDPIIKGCHLRTREDLWLLESFFTNFLLHIAPKQISNGYQVPFRELQHEALRVISKPLEALHTILSYNATLTTIN